MAQLRIAMAQLNPTVGDLAGNSELIVAAARAAAAAGAQVLATTEMAITGYPIEDLVLRDSVVRASQQALADLTARLEAEGLGGLLVVAGYLDATSRTAARTGRPPGSPQNAAAVLHRGRVLIRSAKHHLPNYGVFDEYRYFVPGDLLPVVRVGGIDMAIAICEDLWQDGGTVAAVAESGAGLLLSINASPYELAKDDERYELMRERAVEAGCALVYVNQVGGQDELVFDGDSLVVGPDGALIARAGQFTEELVVVDLELPAGESPIEETTASNGMTIRRVVASAEPFPPAEAAAGLAAPVIEERMGDHEEIYTALCVGLRDYVHKNGFQSVLLGLSGGIDSALVAAIAVDAVGAENVYCVSMPSEYSSEHSKSDAADLAERTGLHFETIPVAPMVDAYLKTIAEQGTKITGVADENLQARVRGTILMALSNQRGHLVLATGNKSELSVGYATLYDAGSIGGYSPIKDVPKTLVWELARWRNESAERRGQTPPIPANSIEKEPSAELRPGQKDSDSLPDYAVLDAVLDLYVKQDKGLAEIVAAGYDPALVERILRLTDRAEYKRRQYPPGAKISPKAFGRDRRLPLTNRYAERA